MAIRKFVGLETEYGIQATVEDPGKLLPLTEPDRRFIYDDGIVDPELASRIFLECYRESPVGKPWGHIRWDYDREAVYIDTVWDPTGAIHLPLEFTLNSLTPNGSRFYIDRGHPEVSTPASSDFKKVVLWDLLGQEILSVASHWTRKLRGIKTELYKNNTDAFGNSYGTHENYLLDRRIDFQRLAYELIPFVVSRQLYAGAGAVGTGGDFSFHISQRARFFTRIQHLQTTARRPIINIRDEPHADLKRFRRFHFILGDANLSEWSTYLKVGTTALVLCYLEEDFIESDIGLRDPLTTLHSISTDLSLKKTYEFFNGNRWTALEIQKYYWDMGAKYLNSHYSNIRDSDREQYRDVLARWGEILDLFEKSEDPTQTVLSRRVDWVIKKRLIEQLMKRQSIDWTVQDQDKQDQVRSWDLLYHLVGEGGFFSYLCERGSVDRIFSAEDKDLLAFARTCPPQDSRDNFRCSCLKKFAPYVYAAAWDRISFLVDGKFHHLVLEDLTRESTRPLEILLKESPNIHTFLTRLVNTPYYQKHME